MREMASARRAARLALVIAVQTALVAGSVTGIAAQDEPEARRFVDGIAELVFDAAWPTATFERFGLVGVAPVAGGYDAAVRLHGRSGWGGGPLWLDLVFEIRGGRLDDMRIGGHNAILAEPFSTIRALGEFIAGLAESSAPSAAPPPARSSYAVRVANDCHLDISVWLHYRDDSGRWVTEGRWDIPGAKREFLAGSAAGAPRIALTSRVVHSYVELMVASADYSWWGERRIQLEGRVLPMRTDTLRDDGSGTLTLHRSCENVPRLGIRGEDARRFTYQGKLYDYGARVLEVDAGSVAARAGLRSGDVIYTLNGRRVEDMATLTRLLVQLRTEPLSLEYVRGDNVARLELEAHAPLRR
jgi:hypothetical protein